MALANLWRDFLMPSQHMRLGAEADPRRDLPYRAGPQSAVTAFSESEKQRRRRPLAIPLCTRLCIALHDSIGTFTPVVASTPSPFVRQRLRTSPETTCSYSYSYCTFTVYLAYSSDNNSGAVSIFVPPILPVSGLYTSRHTARPSIRNGSIQSRLIVHQSAQEVQVSLPSSSLLVSPLYP